VGQCLEHLHSERSRPSSHLDLHRKGSDVLWFMKSPSAVSAVGSFARASPYGVNRIRYKSFFIPVLRFTVRTGLEIVTKHQSRHLLQAEREVVSAATTACGAFGCSPKIVSRGISASGPRRAPMACAYNASQFRASRK